ncbi:hypothetical protein LB507_009974 [Fusarium sp. FIESC RH6]|nr:hypothetical protein LB507_009974 [Fusarium sp. FIESC RH6]
MRSVSALLALAVAGSFELAAAGNCKPSSPLQTDKTAQSASIPTGTTTRSLPSSQTTEGPVVITNAVTNGGFGGYDPSADGGIYAFQAGGIAKLLQGPGYPGQSDERNCVQLKTGPTRKRQTPPENPWIQQQLQDMEPSDYTVRFWYAIVKNSVADTCRIEGYYGGEQFGATPYFPVVSDAGDKWLEFVDNMAVTTNNGMIRFELVCVNGGSAEAYFDQVFVSNKIGDEWVDGISLFFPTSKHAATVGPAETSTALPVDTAVTSSDNIETSEAPTSHLSEAPTTTDEAPATDKTTEAAPTAATSSASTDEGEDIPSGPKVCVKLGAGAAGRGCAKRPYSSKQGYKRFGGSKITKEQCAALCLADSQCMSFEWLYQGSGCANSCNLFTAELGDIPTNGGSDSAWAYDRSCIHEDECAEQPAGTVCVNVNADTPAKACTRFQGVAKACAKPFLTAPTNGLCGLTNECRDLCAKYPSCKSYSATFGRCSLYDARSSEVAEPADAYSFFYDMDCHACGAGNAYFDYIPRGQDPATMPEWTCPVEEKKTSSLLATSTTAKPADVTTSSVNEITSASAAPTENNSMIPTTAPSPTTILPPATVSVCPNGVPSPGFCSIINPAPDRALCGKLGWPQLTDAWGYSVEDRPNQRSIEDCAVLCKEDHRCLAFGFDDSQPTLKCAFISSDLQDASIAEQQSGYNAMWFDMKCMTCMMCGEKEDTTPSPPELGCQPLTVNAGCRYKQNGEWPIGSNGRGVSGYTCHSNGKVTLGEPFSADITTWPHQKSEIQCTETCLQLENCKSSAYNSDTKLCEFFSTSLQDAGYRFQDGSKIWYNDNACFDCSGLCKEPQREDPTGTESMSYFPQPTEAPTTMRTFTRSVFEGAITTSATKTTSASEDLVATTSSAPQNEPTTCTVPSASLSDDVTCGIPGVSNSAQSKMIEGYTAKQVGSLEKCALECLQRPGCEGFLFRMSTALCNIFTAGPAGLELIYNPSSGDKFYDRNCFKCVS